MKTQRYPVLLALVALLCTGITPAWGVNKDMVQLQTQVQDLQDRIAHMQQSFDERMGVLQHLIEQSTDRANKVATSVTDLQTTLQKQQSDSGTHADQLSGQIQSLNDTLDELKARLGKVSKQLEDMQAAQQSMAVQQTQQQQQAASAPPPDVLYNNALRDYQAGKNDLAAQEFGGLREVLSQHRPGREIRASTWLTSSSNRAITRLRSRVTTRSCRVFRMATRQPQPS